MPVKRRTDKRRLDPAAELRAWEIPFHCGRDFFRELPAIGVSVDAYGLPDRSTIEAAWRRLGAAYLAQQPSGLSEPWAQRTFGEPSCR